MNSLLQVDEFRAHLKPKLRAYLEEVGLAAKDSADGVIYALDKYYLALNTFGPSRQATIQEFEGNLYRVWKEVQRIDQQWVPCSSTLHRELNLALKDYMHYVASFPEGNKLTGILGPAQFMLSPRLLRMANKGRMRVTVIIAVLFYMASTVQVWELGRRVWFEVLRIFFVLWACLEVYIYCRARGSGHIS